MKSIIFITLIVVFSFASVSAKKDDSAGDGSKDSGLRHVKDKDFKEHWKKNRMGKGRLYTQKQVAHREAIFLANKKAIEEHNKKEGKTYEQGLNEFSDYTDEERDTLMGTKSGDIPETRSLPSPIFPVYTSTVPPASVDWRAFSPPVLNQGQCGSCWAYASSAVMDTFYRITTGRVLSTSPQYYIDCDRAINNGCFGGIPYYFFRTIQNEGFQTATLSGYPLTSYLSGASGTCKTSGVTKTSTPFLKVNFMRPNGNITVGKQLIYGYGPIVISMQVSTNCNNFYNYRSGIYVDTCGCSTTCGGINHAMVIEGYGVTSAGQPYWLIRNSWGTGWGESGYIRWGIEPTNKCSILCEVAFVERN